MNVSEVPYLHLNVLARLKIFQRFCRVFGCELLS
jgi:hypothetical protein